MSKKISVVKITLSTKKVVLLREMEINDTETAVRLAADRAGDNQFVLGVVMQKELLKMLLFQVDGKAVTAQQKEDLKSLFSTGEFNQLLKVLNKIQGGEESGKDVKVELTVESPSLESLKEA